MGNPAGVKKKKREKRRAKFENRLGPAAYFPKDIREQVNAEIERAIEAEKAEKAKKPAKA